MKTIETRAEECSRKIYTSGVEWWRDANSEVLFGELCYKEGAKEQRKIDIDKACYIFCHTGCPHKNDSYNCLKDKCDTWKIFRRKMEE